MLGDLLPYGAATCLIVAVWALVIARLGLLTRSDVRAWRTLAALRGYARSQSAISRVADRSAALHVLRTELDLGRLLAVAEREESEIAFLGRTAFIALLACAAGVALDAAAQLGDAGIAGPIGIGLVSGLVAAGVRFVLLREAARRRRDQAGRTLGDMMMMVAIMTDGRGLQVEDAIRILARCATTDHLRTLVDGGWRRLVPAPPRSTAELFRAIAREYRIDQFGVVADALTTTNVGVAERQTYARVAHAVYEQRLADARTSAARARILVTLPVAGMLVPLLVLLGAPALQSISAGFGAG